MDHPRAAPPGRPPAWRLAAFAAGAAALLIGCRVAGAVAPEREAAGDREPSRREALQSRVTPTCLASGCHEGFAARLSRQPHLHQSALEGRCTACHEPHGAGGPHRLVERFPGPRHLPFRVEEYALCWRCHDPEAILGEADSVRTGFRNGPRNLHAHHVKQPVKGRSCASCHDVHGAEQEKLVRARSPAKGLLEMSFRRSAAGGLCVSNCHKPLAYDRVSPVAY